MKWLYQKQHAGQKFWDVEGWPMNYVQLDQPQLAISLSFMAVSFRNIQQIGINPHCQGGRIAQLVSTVMRRSPPIWARNAIVWVSKLE